MIRRSARLALLYTLEAVAALLALIIFAGAVVLWRLASGPVALDMLRPTVAERIAEAFDAEQAELGRLSVSYDPALAALVLAAQDVSVIGEDGAVLTAARRIEAGFALDLLLIGRAAPVAFSAQGGSFSLIRRADGTLAAGLGRAADLGPEPGEGSAGLEQLLAGFVRSGEEGSLSRLVRVDLRGADIRVIDEMNEAALLFEEARAAIDLSEARIDADLSGTLLSASGQSPVALGLETDRGLERLLVDLRIRDLVPASIAPRRGPLGPFGGMDAPVDLELVIDAARETGLNSQALHDEKKYQRIIKEVDELEKDAISFAI